MSLSLTKIVRGQQLDLVDDQAMNSRLLVWQRNRKCRGSKGAKANS